MRRARFRFRLFVVTALMSAGLAAVVGTALAGGPVHIKRTLGPFVGDVPAGALCDFPLHEEEIVTQNIKRFFDDAGNLVRVEDAVELQLLHRNDATGFTLTEIDHYAAHVDFVTGEDTLTGNQWHLRNQDGRIVVVGGGLIGEDLFTNEIFKETPNAMADRAATLCPALGGAPTV